MTMILTYDPTFSSVHIDLSAIAPDGAVTIERSANNGPPWEIVRGGVALPVVGGVAELDDYEFFADVPNWYRVTRADSGMLVSGGQSATTPDNVALDITGDIDLRADVSLDDWISGSVQTLVSKYENTGDQRSYALAIDDEGAVRLFWSTNGTAVGTFTRQSTELSDVGNGERLAVRATLDVDNGSGGRTTTFYTAPTIDGPWIQLGDPIVEPGTTSIFASTAILEVGAGDLGAMAGTVHAARVLGGINGAEVANPDFYAEATGTPSFTDDAGRLWTLNGGASILGPEVEAPQQITPDLNGQTWLKSIRYPMLNRAIADPEYRPVQRASRAGLYNIKGRSNPIAVYDVYSSRWWTIETVTYTLAEARDMDLVLAAGGTWFIHTPAEFENECFTNPVSGMPGGYVEIQSATMLHPAGGLHEMQWTLPVRQVQPPPPEVTGSLLTWGTVERIYGSWTALWAANPTWRDLWDQIGSPDDLVVL